AWSRDGASRRARPHHRASVLSAAPSRRTRQEGGIRQVRRRSQTREDAGGALTPCRKEFPRLCQAGRKHFSRAIRHCCSCRSHDEQEKQMASTLEIRKTSNVHFFGLPLYDIAIGGAHP